VKRYGFNSPEGGRTLADLVDGRSQLIAYPFMFAPDWRKGRKSCSFGADDFNGILLHLNHREVTFTTVSRAPPVEINACRKRMGGSFPWVSSCGGDFNFDFQVSSTPEQFTAGKTSYNYERVPKGSNEDGIAFTMERVRRQDQD